MNAQKTLSPDAIAVIDGVPVRPIFGGTQPTHQYGINTKADVLVNQLADGTDLNKIWDEYAEALSAYNTERSSITDLLTFDTTAPGEAVPQNFDIGSFEESTDLGVPKGAGLPGALPLGYTFKDYDLAGRFSWRFLRDADRRQVDGVMNGILAADNRLVTGTILRRLFDPTQKRNEFNQPVFGLWNADGMIPPPHLGREFDGTTTHYLASQANQVDAGDVEDAISLVKRKGYGIAPGTKLLILANPDEAELIMSWRAGEPSRTSGPDASYDFIPAADAPPFITPAGELVGQQVPGQIWGLKVQGSYGEALLIQSEFIPSGFFTVVASGGPNSPVNVMGRRVHPNTAYQPLRHIPGAGIYPIVGSYHQRSFGVGVRQRGAAVCVQVTTGNTYTAPSADQIPV
ncbi:MULTISPECIES: hypothetical protein [unclassified Mycobacterium]|uniref:hypothetical protein n=1 Tax=unclassified Mycobacterium TaxID=2642494 RepID=UPI0009ED9FBE|nr:MULTISPECIES: hypothetical protein [unclassified Mycobacterium]